RHLPTRWDKKEGRYVPDLAPQKLRLLLECPPGDTAGDMRRDVPVEWPDQLTRAYTVRFGREETIVKIPEVGRGTTSVPGSASAPGHRWPIRVRTQHAATTSGQRGPTPTCKRMAWPRSTRPADEQRLDWLRRKANASGCAIETVGLTLVDWRNTKPLRTKGGAA